MTISVTSYTELIGAIRTKVGVLGLRYEDFDELVGLPVRFSGKALGPSEVRKFTLQNLFDVLDATGLRLSVADHPEQDAKIRAIIAKRYLPREANQARYANHASTISTHVLSRAFGHILRQARKKRWAGTTKAERSEHARTIANARWRRHRKRAKAAMKAAKTRKQRLALIPADPAEVSAGRCDG